MVVGTQSDRDVNRKSYRSNLPQGIILEILILSRLSLWTGTCSMATVVLLSSSPRIFARSPTPAADLSSSQLRSPDILSSCDNENSNHCELSRKQLDGVFAGCRDGRIPLSPKMPRENITPWSREGGKKSRATAQLNGLTARKRLTKPGWEDGSEHHTLPTDMLQDEPQSQPGQGTSVEACGLKDGLFVKPTQLQQRTWGQSRQESHSPLQLMLDKAIPRRLDWTPPASRSDACVDSPEGASETFSGRLLECFGYQVSACPKAASLKSREEFPPKRRKIELAPDQEGDIQRRPSGSGKSKQRTKASAKKSITITGLATSLYANEREMSESSTRTIQFLTTTQAQACDRVDLQPSITKSKSNGATKRKKTTAPKFKVFSPESAMKAHDNQDFIFGTASQLAFDELPISAFEARELLRGPEKIMLSDPPSTQLTQPVSVESTTPKRHDGTARFAKTRNLWNAADRDEDNALLHVETVDLFDTPTVRAAFAGKDVMTEPATSGNANFRSPSNPRALVRASALPSIALKTKLCYDIDDITTPASKLNPRRSSGVQQQNLHTSANENPPQKLHSVNRTTNNEEIAAERCNKASVARVAKPRPPKPVYAGCTNSELQKQLSAFGFKPIKKREKMIEVLERCWEDKYGSEGWACETQDPKADPQGPKHGDFLSKVHDISLRPELKATKASRKSKEDRYSRPPVEREKPKPKMKSKVKVPAKQKSEAPALSEERILDIDDINEDAPLTHPNNLSKRPRPNQSLNPLPTPPPSNPHPAPTGGSMTETTATERVVSLPKKVSQPDINDQITRAITSFVPNSELDHQKNPTWHEKILMYDPIILQDLTLWLNTEGLGRIGEDREVGPLEVRDWCESRGICCLWKEG